LDLATQLVSPRNLKEVVGFLEKEVVRARKMDESAESAAATTDYRNLLIKSINEVTFRFPETIPAVLGPLMDSFLMFDGKSAPTSVDSILFVREVIETHPEHREQIFSKICNSFEDIRSPLVLRTGLWIMGEYARSADEIHTAFRTIKTALGSLPLFLGGSEESEKKEEEGKKEETAPEK